MDRATLEQKMMPYWEAGWPHCIAVDEGWIGLVNELFDELVKTGVPFRIVQIKEKFGGLRFYYEDDRMLDPEKAWEIDRLVNLYEQKSQDICERCGNPGSLRTINRWLVTLCDDCLAKDIDRRKL